MYHTFWECVLVITCLFPLNSTETWLWHSTLLNDVELLKFYSYHNRWHVEYVLKVALVAWWVLLYVVILSAVHVGEVCQFGTKYLFVYVEFLFTWNEVHFISYQTIGQWQLLCLVVVNDTIFSNYIFCPTNSCCWHYHFCITLRMPLGLMSGCL